MVSQHRYSFQFRSGVHPSADKANLAENERLYKGIGRGLQLIAIGYLLRINFLALLFKFDIYRWVAGVDVLHVIGIALLSLIGLYILHQNSVSVYPGYWVSPDCWYSISIRWWSG